MLEVIKIDNSKLRCASYKLKNNPSFMLDAFRINAQCLQYASKELKISSTFMLEVIKIYHNLSLTAKTR